MYSRILTFALVGIFLCAGFISAEMTSTNYKIKWDAFSAGGSDTATSTTYLLRDSVDISASARSTSSSYQLGQGYREGVFDQILTFSLYIQDISDARTATALSGLVVTTSTSGVSVGDYVLVVQDRGASQVAAIGKVTVVGGSTLTIDSLSGGLPVIDGSNDYVYQLDGSTIAFGDLSASSVSTAVIAFEVSIDNDSGYVVQIQEDGNLRSGANTISDVSDGAVTAGASEYGARSSDVTLSTTTFDTEDSAITSTYQNVVTESSSSFSSRNFVTLKSSMASSATAGSYGQSLSIIVSGNF